MKMVDLGLIDYISAYRAQREALAKRKNNIIPDTLMMAEHYPVFTLGRTGSQENLLVDKEVLEKRNLKLIDIDRGGDITFHGPGQIVLYPIINLKERCAADLHKYIRNLEAVFIEFLNRFNVKGQRLEGSSGVWVEGKKIGFIGVGVSQWVVFHGAAININTDLNFFSMIKSCGINGASITSLSKILDKPMDMQSSKARLVSSFMNIFSTENDSAIPKLA